MHQALRSPALLVVTSMTWPAALMALTSGAGTVPPPPTRISTVEGSGSCDDFDQPRRIGRQQPAGLADDDDPAVDQEGRGQAGVHDRPDVQFVARVPADLLDDERMVSVAHHVVEQVADGLRDQGGVVALDQVRPSCGPGGSSTRPR